MRKGISWLLMVLGAFSLVAGLLVLFYAADALKRTPMEVDTVTRLSGTADKLNPLKGETELLDVKVASITQTDSQRSDDDVVAWVNTTCVVLDLPDTPDCVDADDPHRGPDLLEPGADAPDERAVADRDVERNQLRQVAGRLRLDHAAAVGEDARRAGGGGGRLPVYPPADPGAWITPLYVFQVLPDAPQLHPIARREGQGAFNLGEIAKLRHLIQDEAHRQGRRR